VDLNASPKPIPHWSKATAISRLTLDAVAAANSAQLGHAELGHGETSPPCCSKHLKFDAPSPLWPGPRPFILSAGTGPMLIHSLLHLTGYEQFRSKRSRNFRQMAARTRPP